MPIQLSGPLGKSINISIIPPSNQNFSGTLGSKLGSRINVFSSLSIFWVAQIPLNNHHVFSHFSHDFLSVKAMIFLGQLAQLPSNPQQSPALYQLPGYPSGIIIDGVTGEEVDPKSWQEPLVQRFLGNIQYQWNFCRIMGFIWEN